MKNLLPIILLLIPVAFAADDFESQKAALLAEKQNIQNDIKKIEINKMKSFIKKSPK